MRFTGEMWEYKITKGAWFFITLPIDAAAYVGFYASGAKGYGTQPVTVKVGETQWQTSVFPDKKSGSFFLPIKAAVRKIEKMNVGETFTVQFAHLNDDA